MFVSLNPCLILVIAHHLYGSGNIGRRLWQAKPYLLSAAPSPRPARNLIRKFSTLQYLFQGLDEPKRTLQRLHYNLYLPSHDHNRKKVVKKLIHHTPSTLLIKISQYRTFLLSQTL